MAEAAVAMSLVSGGLGAIGAINKGEADHDAAYYNSDLDLKNADLVRQQTVQNVIRTKVMGQKVIGDARAGYGASGVSSAEGSALDVLQESAANAEMDALNVKHKGDVEAASYEMDAAMQRKKGDSARAAEGINAFTALLSGGANAFGKMK